jgi:catechol 2,3-dioxygenase-like lactoylglutathione lyase family enzyme
MGAAVVALDHLQLAMPAGEEQAARRFYCDLLGFAEREKPEKLRGRGGLWLRSGSVDLHLGVEKPFRPAKKAHPCFAVDDLDALADILARRARPVLWDDLIAGTRRFYSADPFDNRLEFVERQPGPGS